MYMTYMYYIQHESIYTQLTYCKVKQPFQQHEDVPLRVQNREDKQKNCSNHDLLSLELKAHKLKGKLGSKTQKLIYLWFWGVLDFKPNPYQITQTLLHQNQNVRNEIPTKVHLAFLGALLNRFDGHFLLLFCRTVSDLLPMPSFKRMKQPVHPSTQINKHGRLHTYYLLVTHFLPISKHLPHCVPFDIGYCFNREWH